MTDMIWWIVWIYLIIYAIFNKCFAVISLILKFKAAGMSNAIYAQYPTEIQDIIKHNSIIEDCEILNQTKI